MAKVTQREVLNILRIFEFADESNIPRDVSYLKVTEMTRSTVAGFVFKNYNFYILFDDYLNDEEELILDTLSVVYPGVELKLIKNPRDDNLSYGMPYKAKTVYLAENLITKQRLDLALKHKHPDLSRSTLQKYIKEGLVTVNNDVIITSKYLVDSKDSIILNIPEKTDFSGIGIPIIYEDENVIVMDKPAGVLTHSKGVLNDEFTVADFLSRYYIDRGGLNEGRPGIVHRLDRDTSGVIIGAKNANTAKYLRKQFSDRNVKKTYTAILVGNIDTKEAIIDLPIARNMNKPSTFRVDAGGKPAITKYKILKEKLGNTLVQFNPITGRTHQLRVHALHLNAPILGDKVYGDGTKADRMFLHASELEITIPNGQRKVFKSKIPKEFSL